MSASKVVTIMCDFPSCGQWEDRGVAETAGRARAQLRGTGWRVAVPSVVGRMVRDYCPRHAGSELR